MYSAVTGIPPISHLPCVRWHLKQTCFRLLVVGHMHVTFVCMQALQEPLPIANMARASSSCSNISIPPLKLTCPLTLHLDSPAIAFWPEQPAQTGNQVSFWPKRAGKWNLLEVALEPFSLWPCPPSTAPLPLPHPPFSSLLPPGDPLTLVSSTRFLHSMPSRPPDLSPKLLTKFYWTLRRGPWGGNTVTFCNTHSIFADIIRAEIFKPDLSNLIPNLHTTSHASVHFRWFQHSLEPTVCIPCAILWPCLQILRSNNLCSYCV